ncbi:TetR/AcrR family transcriptional regulator [Umezawaea beigongshangensis]|uniref:TetR/AcrR family transcriptional regulator n=1 Tax=Umezawaea beigongshangensis TaxID=2780383 RepID=UPI0018F24181|nr:TetR/AcrR family transcriptional regulator [Umezawaea beigongshangensis]
MRSTPTDVRGVQRPGADGRKGGPSRGDVRYDKILEVAEALLAEKPLRTITIEDVANRAGITRPTFYFYFDSKYALLAALLERIVAVEVDGTDRWWRARPDGVTPRQACERVHHDVLALWRRHAPVVREATEAMSLDPQLHAVYTQIVDRFVAGASTHIVREREHGSAPPGADPTTLAATLVWMAERNLYAAVADLVPRVSDEQRVAAITDTWVRAIYGTSDPR